VLRVDGILIKEKCGPDETLIEEIGCEHRKPIKQVEACNGLEHEETCDLYGFSCIAKMIHEPYFLT
jgi:hypothetical protein